MLLSVPGEQLLKRNLETEKKLLELEKKTDHENDILSLLEDKFLGHFRLINQPESFLFGSFRMALSLDNVI